jgi:hypothetical protein
MTTQKNLFFHPKLAQNRPIVPKINYLQEMGADPRQMRSDDEKPTLPVRCGLTVVGWVHAPFIGLSRFDGSIFPLTSCFPFLLLPLFLATVLSRRGKYAIHFSLVF